MQLDQTTTDLERLATKWEREADRIDLRAESEPVGALRSLLRGQSDTYRTCALRLRVMAAGR